jgi:secondary thiamine-phosphate synthase enzyme
MFQKKILLNARSRGFHLITEEIISALPSVSEFESGLLNLFIQHTSASLSINENADPTVRADMESCLRQLIPDAGEGNFHYQHDYEGADDMPAHIKASLIGCSLSIPIQSGCLALGTWQGIYLGEHRSDGGSRQVLATLYR